MVECLSSVRAERPVILRVARSAGAHIYEHSMGQVETGGPEDQGHPRQLSKFRASLGYVTLSPNQTKPNQT